MHRVWYSAVLFAPAISLISAACGDSSFSSAGDDAGSNGDVTLQEGSIADASPTDGSTVDDAAAPRFCQSVVGSIFCDDFDVPGEQVGGPWNLDAGFVSTDGGTLTLSGTEARSPPASLQATTAGDDKQIVNAALTEDIGTFSQPVSLAFDLFISPADNNCPAAVDVAQLGIANSLTRIPVPRAILSFTNGVPTLLMNGTATTTSTADAAAPSGWIRVRLVTRLIPPDGGPTSFQTDVFFDNPGSDDFVDASARLSGFMTPAGLNVTTATVGLSSTDNALPCTAYFDNVVIRHE